MRLAEREVHLWHLSLGEAPISPALLSAEEQVRAQAFRCTRARDTFIESRTALRRVLGRYLDLPPEAVVLTQGRHGKPRLGAGQGALEFNVCHSGRKALIALSHVPVGVDIECLEPSLNWRELVPLCCHPDELKAFEDLTDAQGRAQLLRLWTAKEAYVKGRGEGMSLPFTALCLHERRSDWRASVEPAWDDGQAWRLLPLALPVGYFGALATPLTAPLIRHQRFVGQAHARPAASSMPLSPLLTH